jgi:glutathione S-transferase
MMMGACQKCLHAAYERNRRPLRNCISDGLTIALPRLKTCLVAVDAMIDPKRPYLLFERTPRQM